MLTQSILGRFFFSPNFLYTFVFFPQLWCSRMISMQVQKPCSADTLMTQQQTRTSPKGNGVCWLSLPSWSFATNRPSITSHAFLHSLPFTHFDSVYLFDIEVICPSLFECMLSWLHCMQLCSCHAYRCVGRWVRLCKRIIHDVFKKFKVSKNMFWRGFFFVFCLCFLKSCLVA